MTLQTFTLGTFAQQGVAAGDFDSIATVTVGAGGAASVTFSSIPGTYAHLQIRGIARTSGTTTDSTMTFNSDTSSGSYYANHQIYGDGSSATAAYSPASTRLDPFYTPGSGVTSGVFASFVIDVLDYANTNKYKTLRTLQGWDANGSGFVIFRSGLWMKTSAITQIDWAVTGNFAQYSHFALYGIKAA